MMPESRPKHAGTDYTVQASLVVIATGTAAAPSGFSAQALGYARHFLLSAALCAVGTASQRGRARRTADTQASVIEPLAQGRRYTV